MSKKELKIYKQSISREKIKSLTGWSIDEIAEAINNSTMKEKEVDYIGLIGFRGCPWYDNLIKADGEYYLITDKSTGHMNLQWFNGDETDYKRMCI